jgi:hypothetical protein
VNREPERNEKRLLGVSRGERRLDRSARDESRARRASRKTGTIVKVSATLVASDALVRGVRLEKIFQKARLSVIERD